MDNMIMSTLIGGALAVIGGILGASFTQYFANKAEWKRLVISKSDELYNLINDLDREIHSSGPGLRDPLGEVRRLEMRKLSQRLRDYINKIELTTDIYLHEQSAEIYDYCKIIKEYEQKIKTAVLKNEDIDGPLYDILEALDTEREGIRKALVKHRPNTPKKK